MKYGTVDRLISSMSMMGELSFSWANIDTAYIQYDGERYEIINESVPPLNLDV